MKPGICYKPVSVVTPESDVLATNKPKHIIIFLHTLQTHHAVTLDKAADQQSPPHQHYTKFGWDIKDGIPISSTANQPAGLPELIQVINATA